MKCSVVPTVRGPLVWLGLALTWCYCLSPHSQKNFRGKRGTHTVSNILSLVSTLLSLIIVLCSRACGWGIGHLRRIFTSKDRPPWYGFNFPLLNRCCFLSAHSWRIQTLMIPWCQRLLTCTRLIELNMRARQGAGPRSTLWAKRTMPSWEKRG